MSRQKEIPELIIVNNFYVALQALLENAEERGWGITFIEKTALEAVEEWVEEKYREKGWL